MKFGYEIIKGKYVVNVTQATIINKIMHDYINGDSLKTKAEELTEQKIEYAPGKSTWNKNRIQRILMDRTYLGTDVYPVIVQSEIFEEVQKVIDSRNTQKNTNRDEIFSSSIVPILCSKCGGETYRRLESRTKQPRVLHICKNPDCKKRYVISDINLRAMIRDKLALCETNDSKLSNDDTIREIRKLDNEIEQELRSIEIDSVMLKNKILACAALQYSQYTLPKESIDYSKMELCSLKFNREIKSKVKTVYLESNERIWLYMVDGQIVGKDVQTNECSNHTT